ncbi:MAG: hypothetical protein ACRDMZ_12985, partial [Solirubrobacteraceae bacterium]
APAYKACTSEAALALNRARTARIRELTLEQSAHARSTLSMLGYGTSAWPGAEAHVLKAALVRDRDATPVETARTHDAIALAGLVAAYFARLRAAGHAIPHCSVNTSAVFVEAVIRTAIDAPAEWTGRVARTWRPYDGINPHFPPLADRVGIAQAVSNDFRTPDSGGFTWMRCGEAWLVGFGPSVADHYYVHRPLLLPSRDGRSTAIIEQRVRERAAELDALADPLAGYVPERMLIHPNNHASFDHVAARILFTWQFPRWSPPPTGNDPKRLRPRNPSADRARRAS